MAAMSSLLLAGGLGLGLAGTGMQFMGLQAQAKAQKSVVAANIAGEQTRQSAMKLDATRRTREMVRQSIVARGAAENEAANSGTQYGSGLPGTTGQISNQSQYNIAGVQGQATLGETASKYNMEGLYAGGRASEAGTSAAMGAGITSLGGSLINSIGPITRLGNYATGTPS